LRTPPAKETALLHGDIVDILYGLKIAEPFFVAEE
jgi:hypothetical protein